MPERHDEIPWEGECSEAAWVFGRKCRDLAKSTPYGDQVDPLGRLIDTLMTELWDNGFSQTEIRKAFEDAVRDMPRYAAGKNGVERKYRRPASTVASGRGHVTLARRSSAFFFAIVHQVPLFRA